jgi:hypothetical protein
MDVIQNMRPKGLLIRVGSFVLVAQLIIFQRAFGIVENPVLSGSLRDVVSGGMLLIAVVSIGTGTYLHYQDS